jgi:DNA polymerase I-like protein with 3'-5' exonuclease and polymerase domains
MTRLLFDLETDGFLATCTKIHCVGILDVETGEYTGYRPEQVAEAARRLEQADEILGHNVQRFDVPVLKKLCAFQPKAGQQIKDTMVMGRVIYPNLKATDRERQGFPSEYVGKHTIAAWGYRLGEHKGDYAQVRRAQAMAQGITDEKAIAEYVWGTFNEDMFEYMAQDCATNFALWKHLRPDDYPRAPLDLEHRAAKVCDAIEEAGVPFDLRGAQELHARLVERKHELEQRLIETFGSWEAPISPDPTKAWFVPKRDNKKLGYVAGVGFTKMKAVQFNPKSRDHIAKVLMDRGWKPEKFTDGGKPQLDEETIEGVVGHYPEMAGIGELLMVEKRLSQLTGSKQSLMDNVKEDGRIHGAINPMGTITSRGAHFSPNLGQVPSAKKPYGTEFRQLFYHGKTGWKIVGADMEGLELRGLAHYLAYYDGGAYGKVVLDGDPHWVNVIAMGLLPDGTVRDKHNKLHTILREDGSKRFIYAYVYGAGDLKCGEIIYEAGLNAKKNAEGGEEVFARVFGNAEINEDTLRKVGGKVRRSFAKKITGFSKLQANIEARIAQDGYVNGLDRRKTPIRKAHSALNFLIQSAGAILCKRWMCDAFDEMNARWRLGEDFQFVLWVHDELQVLCREEIADEVGECLVSNARRAGHDYGFRLPLDSKYSIGNSWADTH